MPAIADQHGALDDLTRDVSIDDLAVRAHVSRRTLDRHFRTRTGASPLQWLLHQRVSTAQHLLETTDLDIEAVARGVGFTSATALRPHFRPAFGVSPRAYRQSFRRDHVTTSGING